MTTTLKDYCKTLGADSAGVADLEPFKQGWVVLPENLLTPYTRAVSVAKRLDNEIMNSLTNGPTVEYAGQYRQVNGVLAGEKPAHREPAVRPEDTPCNCSDEYAAPAGPAAQEPLRRLRGMFKGLSGTGD